jgi:hypothetical protein
MNAGTTMLAVYEPLPQWLNFLAMFVALVLGVFGVLLWAVMFRRKRRRKHKYHKHGEHRGERKPNPTLAETGGLPPPRTPEKSPDEPTLP